MLCVMFWGANAWGQESQVLFHETFGDNAGKAREWSDTYSVKSGVKDVYSHITEYTIANVKQGKNTTGQTKSGLNQSSQGTDASIIIGPLNTANCSSMVLSYYWKAASVKGQYSSSAYYATSSGGTYTKLGDASNGATSFVKQSFDMPADAQVNTMYLKIVWNTSNTQGIIDEVDLSGVYTTDPSAPQKPASPTFSLAEGTYFVTQIVKVADYNKDLIYYYTTDGTDPSVDGNFDPMGNTLPYDDATGITISATTTVKMIACDLEKVSPVKTATYTITTPDATDIMALRRLGEGTYNVTLTDAVVTYVNNKNAYIQDATGGLLIYATHSLKAGDKINGQVSVVLVDYNGTDEATTFDVSKATVTSDNAIPVTNVSLADLLAEGGMKRYESMYVCVSGIQVVTPIANRNGMISQDANQIAVREGVSNCLSTTCLMTANSMANVYGYPTTYTSNSSTTYQLTLWNASAVEEITTITVSAAGYATYYNSAKAYTLPAGCEGYVFDEGKLGSAYNAGEVVPADEPLVIKAEAGTYVLNFTTTEKQSLKSAGNNDLEGTDEETALPAEDAYYFYGLSLNSAGELSSVGFYWMNETGAAFTNGAHKAYLKLAKNNGAGNKAFVFGDEETAIKSVEAENASEAIYDLSGRRVSKALKGLYIINGKKVVK